MVDDGVGRTATKHRMTKRARQGVAQSRVDPRGRRRWIKVSPAMMNLMGKQRQHCSPVDGEKSKSSEPMGPLGTRCYR
jgi:hypothetical protein